MIDGAKAEFTGFILSGRIAASRLIDASTSSAFGSVYPTQAQYIPLRRQDIAEHLMT